MSRREVRAQAAFVATLAKGPRGQLWRVSLPPMTELHMLGLPCAITEGWRDNHHAVWVSNEPTAWGEVIHLWVRRHDGAPIRSWSAMQQIKDEIAGPERMAVEVYPARGDLVDQANMYHLWVLPEGTTLPFGLGGETKHGDDGWASMLRAQVLPAPTSARADVKRLEEDNAALVNELHEVRSLIPASVMDRSPRTAAAVARVVSQLAHERDAARDALAQVELQLRYSQGDLDQATKARDDAQRERDVLRRKLIAVHVEVEAQSITAVAP